MGTGAGMAMAWPEKTLRVEDATQFRREVARLVKAAGQVVQDHVADCQASYIRAEARVRVRAAQRYGGAGEGWRYFASPAVLELAAALRAMEPP